MIFDTHAHYDDEQFDTDREALLASLSLSASHNSQPGVASQRDITGEQEHSCSSTADDLRTCDMQQACDCRPEMSNETGDTSHGLYGVVTHVCDATASVESLHKVMDLVKPYDNMYCTIGIHPDEVGDITDQVWEDIRTLARDPKCVAIGEIGLDYYWDKEGHDLQEKWFRAQIELALELGKPINVHSREACEDTMRIIREYYGKNWSGKNQSGDSCVKQDDKSVEARKFYPGIIHCFSYSPEIAELYVQMGFAIGVGGVVTYKNGRKLKEVVQRIPLERIVLETDCPYLSPTPNRGKRNSSLNLPYVVAEIAALKEVTPETVEDVTFANACRIYGVEH